MKPIHLSLALLLLGTVLGCMRAKEAATHPSVSAPSVSAPVAADATPHVQPMSSAPAEGSAKSADVNIYQSYIEDGAAPPEPIRLYIDKPSESYARIEDSTFKNVSVEPLSTFSIDVDSASYANVRRYLTEGKLPPADAVRIEELINYFPYNYPQPSNGEPFVVSAEAGACPWAPSHRLARIGIKGVDIPDDDRRPANLVFLIDVSGSMEADNKLPLVQRSLRLLVPRLRADDRLAIVTYSDSASVALDMRRGTDTAREKALALIETLRAGGSTQGSDGLRVAYRLANDDYRKNAINRVILCTDGDFNVGVTENDALVDLVRREAKKEIFLTVLGFGTGNLKDSRLERMADDGNGKYDYVDSITAARKLFLEELTGSLVTIAKDVKIQVEFNPARVAGYRLIGYENRVLNAEEFNDDTRDAGEIGAGHTVTALYELIPNGQEVPGGAVDTLRYREAAPAESDFTTELMFVKVRYKPPREDESILLTFPVRDTDGRDVYPSQDYQFAAAVAGFGMLLRESPYAEKLTYDTVVELANTSRGIDEFGYRAEFVNLARNAAALAEGRDRTARR